jgi:predicted Fe-S protein YdhL (DUF1289 family)
MDDVWKRNEIDSPCVKICVVHPESRLCIGCMRTIDEISQWSKFTPDERAAVKAELPGRAPLLRGTRRGRRRG